MKKPALQMEVEKESGCTERKKQKGEGETDLTKQIHGESRIIPYIPSKMQVYNASGTKFNAKGKGPDGKGLPEKPGLSAADFILVTGIEKNQSSGNEHGPVGITTE